MRIVRNACHLVRDVTALAAARPQVGSGGRFGHCDISFDVTCGCGASVLPRGSTRRCSGFPAPRGKTCSPLAVNGSAERMKLGHSESGWPSFMCVGRAERPASTLGRPKLAAAAPGCSRAAPGSRVGAVELNASATTRSRGTPAPKGAAHRHGAPGTGRPPPRARPRLIGRSRQGARSDVRVTRTSDDPSIEEHRLCHTPRLVGRVRRAGGGRRASALRECVFRQHHPNIRDGRGAHRK